MGISFGLWIVLISVTTAQIKGFNYGSLNFDNTPRTKANFTALFYTAHDLTGTSGFSSARLYTMIDAGSVKAPISAIPAAIDTKTSLLLGLWASGGQDHFDNELAALSDAVTTYGSAFSDLVIGISVGSEDLYRDSSDGIANNAGLGVEPLTILKYMSQVRANISGTLLERKPVGHVDTWTAYVNASNAELIPACDFIGVDAYPYFESSLENSVDNGTQLFHDAYNRTLAVAQGKPVWITETGWPVSGPTRHRASADIASSKAYWDGVGCSLFDKVNVWWYTLFDGPAIPSFGLVDNPYNTTALFDLTCSASSGVDLACS